MLLDLTCPACGGTLRATDEVFGKVVRCPACEGCFPVAPPDEPVIPHRSEPITSRGPAAPRQHTAPQPWVYAILGGAATLIVVASLSLIGPHGSGLPGASGGVRLSTAEVVARAEPSVALIRGTVSSGTGFLVRPGLVATNAHVIDDEFLDGLEVRFPSAPEGARGPLRARLLYEDTRRDLAILAVRSGLPALELARAYRFLKGEDVTVIGSPGLGDEVVLENAISRGVMSSRASIDGQDFLQMSIAINPGNSGGPILDPGGRVIGVATLKSSKAESLGFGIPVEDVAAALIRMDLQPDAAQAAAASRHRARAAFRALTAAGALYAAALRARAGVLARAAAIGPETDLLPTPHARAVDDLIDRLERRQLARLDDELSALRSDKSLEESARRGYDDLASNYREMKDLYLRPTLPAGAYAARSEQLRANHLRLATALGAAVGFPIPRDHRSVLESGSQGEPAPDSLARLVPGPPRPWPRPFPMAPPPFRGGPFAPVPFDPGHDARARAESLHQRLEDLRRRMESVRPRLGP